MELIVETENKTLGPQLKPTGWLTEQQTSNLNADCSHAADLDCLSEVIVQL